MSSDSEYINCNVDGFNWVVDVTDGGIGRTLELYSRPQWRAEAQGKDFSFARERVFMNILDCTIRPGFVCIDLGANIGYATMFMIRNSGPTGTVYAIEPDDHNIQFLNVNLSQNNYTWEDCEITRCVITDHDGEVDFWLSDKPNLNSVNKTKHSVKSQSIPCMTLETFCETRKYPNFIKMDIEGHEVKVFESGLDYFTKNSGETHILLETHPKEYNDGNDFAKILKEYNKAGFNISYLVATPTSNPAPFAEGGYKPRIEVQSDGWVRSLYTDVAQDDAVRFTTELFDDVHGGKCVRSIMVSRDGK